jgi:hypothetical protein
MKTFLSLAVATIICVTLSASSYAAESVKAASKYEDYTCGELTALNFESVGPVVYYVRGHYDAKHDIWTD